MVSVFVRGMLVQLETPDSIRGRVSAVNSMFIGASNELGVFRAGMQAAWMGIVRVDDLGRRVHARRGRQLSRLFPQLRKLDRFPDPSALMGTRRHFLAEGAGPQFHPVLVSAAELDLLAPCT